MKTLENNLMQEMKQLDVQYIVWSGYYTNEDQDELKSHTNETLELWNKGFEVFNASVVDDEVDYFNGITFDLDNSPLADCHIDGVDDDLKIEVS